jgi:hypothetical protein
VPAVLDGLEADGLIEAGEANESVDDGGHGGDFAELHAKEGGDEIEAGDSDQAPIQSTDYHQDGREHVEFLHDVFSPAVKTACNMFNYRDNQFNGKANTPETESRMNGSQMPSAFLLAG